MGDLLVVLDLGRPAHRHGSWGTTVFGGGYRSTDQIATAAEAYATGFWRCSGRRPLHLRVAIGTSNYGRGVTWSHGRAWARMVNGANDWLQGRGYTSRIDFAGANDIELGWNGPKVSRAWVAGYDSAGQFPFYDYGDAGACPPAGNCVGRWTMEDLWYVSWGARTAWPLPEIYSPTGVNARQWHLLSLYSLRHHGYPMRIAGALSQLTACRQSSDPCRGTRNSPTRAWTLLWRALNADPRTAQPLRWSSDISW